MNEKFLGYVLQYSGLALKPVILLWLFRRGYANRLAALCSYLVLGLALQLMRTGVLYAFGVHSRHYFYWYYLTDFVQVLALFALVCVFFRRACAGQGQLWHHVRVFLASALCLVGGISGFSLKHNYNHLFSSFIIEFEQNLYFACLVLNTLLFLLIQQMEREEDELGLLVCGLGIQFAGPAASFALLHLTMRQQFSVSLSKLIVPFSGLSMLLVWLYAVATMPKPVEGTEGANAFKTRRKTLAPEGAVAASKA